MGCVPGPHPVVPSLLERGVRIADRDQFCATDPDLIDPARLLPSPASSSVPRLAPRRPPSSTATGAGFSIGTPIRLPYSVHDAVVVADPLVAEQLVQDEPGCGSSARRSGSRR